MKGTNVPQSSSLCRRGSDLARRLFEPRPKNDPRPPLRDAAEVESFAGSFVAFVPGLCRRLSRTACSRQT
jgi:hypothetical protein